MTTKEQQDEIINNLQNTLQTTLKNADEGVTFDSVFEKMHYLPLTNQQKLDCLCKDFNDEVPGGYRSIGMAITTYNDAHHYLNMLTELSNADNGLVAYSMLMRKNDQGDNVLMCLFRNIPHHLRSTFFLDDVIPLLEKLRQGFYPETDRLKPEEIIHQILDVTNSRLETLGYLIQQQGRLGENYDEYIKKLDTPKPASASTLRQFALHQPAREEKTEDPNKYDPNVFIRDFP